MWRRYWTFTKPSLLSVFIFSLTVKHDIIEAFMNTYQKEQFLALQMVRRHMGLLEKSPGFIKRGISDQIAEYLSFRDEMNRFYKRYFEPVCSKKCYGAQLSACCSKDGIITFWADHVINVIESGEGVLDRLGMLIKNPENQDKCIYLQKTGCAWKVKPIVCEMFLCPEAEKSVFDHHPEAERHLYGLKKRKKEFTWPDQPVLFETLEDLFVEAGLDSEVMYMHKSPGLLRLIRKRGSSMHG